VTRDGLATVRQLATAAATAATAAYQSLACTRGAIGLPRLRWALREAYDRHDEQITAAVRARDEIAHLLEQDSAPTDPPPATSTPERLDELARLVRGPDAALLSGAVRVRLYTWQQRGAQERLTVLREAQDELRQQRARVDELTGRVQQLIADLDR
jgi:hypothetical protein